MDPKLKFSCMVDDRFDVMKFFDADADKILPQNFRKVLVNSSQKDFENMSKCNDKNKNNKILF